MNDMNSLLIHRENQKGEHMNEQLLTRLAESLEGINLSLADITQKLDKIGNSVELLEKQIGRAHV